MTKPMSDRERATEILIDTELGDGPICMLHPGHFSYKPVLEEAIATALSAVRKEERERCCQIVFGQCDSDNVAQRTVNAIRNQGGK